MDEKEKSLLLAKLMRWNCHIYKTHVNFEGGGLDSVLQPYEGTSQGLAQFAAILLENMEIFEDGYVNGVASFKPTQENILDEILRMNGIEA